MDQLLYTLDLFLDLYWDPGARLGIPGIRGRSAASAAGAAVTCDLVDRAVLLKPPGGALVAGS